MICISEDDYRFAFDGEPGLPSGLQEALWIEKQGGPGAYLAMMKHYEAEEREYQALLAAQEAIARGQACSFCGAQWMSVQGMGYRELDHEEGCEYVAFMKELKQ